MSHLRVGKHLARNIGLQGQFDELALVSFSHGNISIISEAARMRLLVVRDVVLASALASAWHAMAADTCDLMCIDARTLAAGSAEPA